jgi:hypothetical protein
MWDPRWTLAIFRKAIAPGKALRRQVTRFRYGMYWIFIYRKTQSAIQFRFEPMVVAHVGLDIMNIWINKNNAVIISRVLRHAPYTSRVPLMNSETAVRN